MSCLSTIPDREEDTRFLASLLVRGLQTAVANLFGCYPQTIQQQCDPECPTHSWFAQFKRFQWSLDHSDLDKGDKLWNNLSEDRRGWREAIVAQRRDEEAQDLDTLTEEIGTEFLEFVTARLKGKPREVQERECDDIIRKARQFRKAIKSTGNVEQISGRQRTTG